MSSQNMNLTNDVWITFRQFFKDSFQKEDLLSRILIVQ